MKHYHKKALYNVLQYITKNGDETSHVCKNPWECKHISHDIHTLQDLLDNPQNIEETLTFIRKEGL